jgi:hypothetical protein
VRIRDILYFSPKYKFIDLKWDDKDNLLKAFQDRVEGFYMEPARKLNKEKKAFAAGVLCVATIDFLARIETGLDKVGERFEYWVKDNIEQFNKPNPDKPSQTLAYRFYDEFRNGLVHEGRIKNAGQFSHDRNKLVEAVKTNGAESVMIVNPDYLLNAIATSLKGYLKKVKDEQFVFQAFRCVLIRDFQKDVKYTNR